MDSQFSEKSPYWFMERLSKFTFPPAMKDCSLYSTSSPASVIIGVFILSHSDCEIWYLSVILICISVMAQYVEHSLKYLLAIWYSSVDILCLILYPIFKLDYLEYWYIIFWVLPIFWKLVLCLMWGCWLGYISVLFTVSILAEKFQFQEVLFIYYFSQCLCYWCYI